MEKSPPFKLKKKTKKKIVLVAKTPSPPHKTTIKVKTPMKTIKKKKFIIVDKTPSPPKTKTPSPPRKTLKKKLNTPKEKKEKTPIKDTDLKTSPVNIVMTTTRYNEPFIDILGELGDILQRQGDPFKARAYLQAQETIMTYPEDIHNIKQLKGLKGIGTAIYSKLEEYINYRNQECRLNNGYNPEIINTGTVTS